MRSRSVTSPGTKVNPASPITSRFSGMSLARVQIPAPIASSSAKESPSRSEGSAKSIALVRRSFNASPATQSTNRIWSQLTLTPPEEFNYTSFDGKKIQAWIQKPPDFDPHKKYPLILDIHGGPHAAYGWVFDHEFQWMAAKGYVVLYPNPRGSTSYGQEFGNIIQY